MNNPAGTDNSAEPTRVLLVEDAPLIRRLIVTMLEKAGFVVFEAGHGKEALEKLGEARPDIVLCDLSMPEMDGLEFLKYMKSNEETRAIPMAILSADEGRELEDELKAAGAVALLDKAMPPGELADVIRGLLAEVRSQ